MEASNITENAAVTGSDGGRSMANIVYVLYLIGFFTGITALAGVVIAYINKAGSSTLAASHFNHQIKIFWRGVILMVVAWVLYLICAFIGAATMGIGFILMVIPFAIGVYWFVWTLIKVIKGMQALGRGETVGANSANLDLRQKSEPQF